MPPLVYSPHLLTSKRIAQLKLRLTQVEFNWTFHERDSDAEHYRKADQKGPIESDDLKMSKGPTKGPTVCGDFVHAPGIDSTVVG